MTVAAAFSDSVRAAHAIGARLLAARDAVAPFMPVTAQWYDRQDPTGMLALDAFIQRYGSLQDTLHHPVFRSLVALLRFEPPRYPRDLIDVMEKIGVVADAERWFRMRDLRNVLAHEYPNDRETQVERLNDAFATAGELVRTVDRVLALAREQAPAGLTDLAPLLPDPP